MTGDGSSSLVTAVDEPDPAAQLGRALSVAEQIARVVDSLEEAVDDLLDAETEETEGTEGTEETTDGDTGDQTTGDEQTTES